MKKFYFVFYIISITINAVSIKKEAEKLIVYFFNKDVDLFFLEYQIPKQIKLEIENVCQQRFFKDRIYLWKVFENGRQIATAILDNVYGKSLPITFLVIFDLEGNIINTEVIRYREQYGGAVKSKQWLRQFVGKNSESQYKVGKDISSISGATISVKSVTTGIKKLALLYNKIKNEL